MKLTEEEYFFRWSFTCYHTHLERNQITKEEYDKYEKLYWQGKAPSLSDLEKVTSDAFRRMKIIASKKGFEPWSIESINYYWKGGGHNEIIDNKEGSYARMPESQLNFCKVRTGKVQNIISNGDTNFLQVNFSDGTSSKFIEGVGLEANVGDEVYTHLFFAVEKK